MKTKAFAITAVLLLSAFVSLSILNQVQAESFTATWAGYAFHGADSFYKETIVAYESGSTAVLYVSVTHDNDTYMDKQMNVSAVGISLNWGDTFNSTQANKTNPVALNWEESRIFTITFTVPSTANVSNLFRWDYKMYVEHVDANGTMVDIDVKTRKELELSYFVVYSTEQALCKQIAEAIDGIKRELDTPIAWNTTKAGILWKRAMNESSTADYYYSLGDFSQAVVRYGKALSLIDEAFTHEETKGAALEDAQIANLEAQVKVAEAWANFANGLSNMGTLIGVALVLFALGYIIRGLAMLRKTQIPT